MRTQLIVQESDKVKRGQFFDYITNKYTFVVWYPYERKRFQESRFTFVVDFKEKSFWVCESITCCACAAQAGVIISIDEFYNQENELLKLKKYKKLLKN